MLFRSHFGSSPLPFSLKRALGCPRVPPFPPPPGSWAWAIVSLAEAGGAGRLRGYGGLCPGHAGRRRDFLVKEYLAVTGGREGAGGGLHVRGRARLRTSRLAAVPGVARVAGLFFELWEVYFVLVFFGIFRHFVLSGFA